METGGAHRAAEPAPEEAKGGKQQKLERKQQRGQERGFFDEVIYADHLQTDERGPGRRRTTRRNLPAPSRATTRRETRSGVSGTASWRRSGACTGEVSEEQFSRLADGQHPETGEQLVRHQQAREYKNEAGETVKTMEHRAGWDATFSAPKSVSLTALVGGDERVREAHRESVAWRLDEMERYVQARIGGNAPAETTGKWAAAKFEHDSARPVDGYAAPQLHTHVVFFNVTETEDGKTHAVQPQELYRSQQYATAVYQTELAMRLKELGYEIEPGKNGAPEIRGYTAEYLEAISPRSQQIKEHMAEQGVDGAGAAQIAAHRTRDAKLALTPEEMLARHREMAEAFGNQPERIVQAAKEKTHAIDQDHDARLEARAIGGDVRPRSQPGA